MPHRWAVNDAGKIPWLNSYLEELGMEEGKEFLHHNSEGNLVKAEQAIQYDLIASGDATTGWTGFGGTMSLDSGSPFEGSGSIKLVSTAAGNGWYGLDYTYGTAQDFINVVPRLHLACWLYMTSTNVQASILEFIDSLGNKQAYNFTPTWANQWFLATGQYMDYSGGGTTKVEKAGDAGASDLTDVKTIRIAFQEPATPANPTLYLDLLHRCDAWAWYDLDWNTNGQLTQVERWDHNLKAEARDRMRWTLSWSTNGYLYAVTSDIL